MGIHKTLFRLFFCLNLLGNRAVRANPTLERTAERASRFTLLFLLKKWKGHFCKENHTDENNMALLSPSLTAHLLDLSREGPCFTGFFFNVNMVFSSLWLALVTDREKSLCSPHLGHNLWTKNFIL